MCSIKCAGAINKSTIRYKTIVIQTGLYKNVFNGIKGCRINEALYKFEPSAIKRIPHAIGISSDINQSKWSPYKQIKLIDKQIIPHNNAPSQSIPNKGNGGINRFALKINNVAKIMNSKAPITNQCI